MAYCTACGSPVEGRNFCTECGQPVGESAATGAAPAATAPVAQTRNSQPISTSSLATAPADPPRRSRSTSRAVLTVVVVGAALVLAGIFGLLFHNLTQSQSSATSEASAKPTVTVTSPQRTVTASPSVAATKPAPEEAGTGTSCGGGAEAVGPTSCPFARNVAEAFRSSGGAASLPGVYSPVTGLNYDMTCDLSVRPVRCVGGNDAMVLID